MVSRGFSVSGGVLCVIDGAKALASGIRKVFGEEAKVQRCTIHKRRNVAGHLPKEMAATIDRRLALIFAQPDAQKGLDAAKGLAREVEGDQDVYKRQAMSWWMRSRTASSMARISV